MKVFTIGFTQKSAERFFALLRDSGAKRLVDVRLNNSGQLSAFAKKDDLRFFLRELCRMDYVHQVLLAPEQWMLDRLRSEPRWTGFDKEFVSLIASRDIGNAVPKDQIADGCLLCSEADPKKCHRWLVTEYLQKAWGDLEVVHLV